MSLISGCGTTIATDGCAGFDLIYPSRIDTVETKRQIAVHNETYREICE